MSTAKHIHEWSVGDVATWLDQNGLSKHKQLLCEEHQLDGAAILSLTENDLRKPPVQMTVLGMFFIFLYNYYATSNYKTFHSFSSLSVVG